MRALAVAADRLRAPHVQVLHDAEEVLARTALELAEAMLGYELAEGTRTARAALGRALLRKRRRHGLAIRLNPADIEVLAKEGQDLPAGLPLRRGSVAQPRRRQVDYPQGWLDAASAPPWTGPATRCSADHGLGAGSPGGQRMIAQWRPGRRLCRGPARRGPERVGRDRRRGPGP